MANAKSETVTTTTVTLVLSEKEASALQRLLGFHIAGVGEEVRALEEIYNSLTEVPLNANSRGPLSIDRSDNSPVLMFRDTKQK